MIREVVEGQERFASMFSCEQKLTKNLKEYKITVETLVDLVNKDYSKMDAIMQSVKARNFNLLLRQCASEKNKVDLLGFLLQNLTYLNINIHSRGEKSGSAMDIATRNQNEKAVKLLAKHTAAG